MRPLRRSAGSNASDRSGAKEMLLRGFTPTSWVQLFDSEVQTLLGVLSTGTALESASEKAPMCA